MAAVNKTTEFRTNWLNKFYRQCGYLAACWSYMWMNKHNRNQIAVDEKFLADEYPALKLGLFGYLSPNSSTDRENDLAYRTVRKLATEKAYGRSKAGIPSSVKHNKPDDTINPKYRSVMQYGNNADDFFAYLRWNATAPANLCRCLMEGKNGFGQTPFTNEPGKEGEGPKYFSGRTLAGGVDGTLFNVVVSTLFAGEIIGAANKKNLGFDGPQSFTKISQAYWSILTKGKKRGKSPLLALWYCDDIDGKVRIRPIAPHKASKHGANWPEAPKEYKNILGHSDWENPLWTVNDRGLELGRNSVKNSHTWKKPTTFNKGNMPFGATMSSHPATSGIPNHPDIAYAGAQQVMDLWMEMVLRIGFSKHARAAKGRNSARKDIISGANKNDPVSGRTKDYKVRGGTAAVDPSKEKEGPKREGVKGEQTYIGGTKGEVTVEGQPKRELKEGEVNAIDVQCYLLENITKLAAIREDGTYKSLGKISTAMPGNIVSQLHHGAALQSEHPQDNTNARGLPPGEQGEQPDWPPMGTGPDSEVYWMQNMCPDLWALMTPHIDLYRVDYHTPVDSAGKKGKSIPVAEYKIPFKNYLDKSNIDEITSGQYGRMGGAGIKSFSWSLDGVQPAEVDNMITAQLVVHFQSVYDLFRYNEVPGKAGEYAAGIPAAPGYLDLIIGSGTTVAQSERPPAQKPKKEEETICALKHQEYDGVNFQIKAVVGWATPPNFQQLQLPGYNSLQLKAIENAINHSRRAFYLQIVSHDLGFQQDGTLDLTIQYQASISGIMRKPDADLFIATEVHQQQLDAINDEMEALEVPDVVEEGSLANRDKKNSEALDKYEKKREEILEKQVAIMRKIRLEKYAVFLDSLQKTNRVRALKVPSKDLLNPLRNRSAAQRMKDAKVRQGQTAKLVNYTGDVNNQEITSLVSKMVNRATGNETKDEKKKREEENMELAGMADEVGILDTGNNDEILVSFFYLGDLLEALFSTRLKHLFEKQGEEATPLQLILGTVELVDPLTAFTIRTVKLRCPDGTPTASIPIAKLDPLRFKELSGITSFMNIGSIPISLDKFNEWFVNNVIRPRRDSYFLLNFIKDLLANLVGSAYSELCFKDNFKFDIRFDTSTFQLAENFAAVPNLTLKKLAQSVRKAQKKSRKRLVPESERGDVSPYSGNKTAASEPTIPTVLIYSVDSRPNVGDRMYDMTEGIYHYYLGGSCGLTKSINFNRQDMPFYREARITKDGSLGAQQLKELYTIDMDMIGNTLHKNGTYVYIDPIAIGAGSSRAIGGIPNIARMIGLGGYFLVTSVKSEIGPSGFNTTVGATQEMSNFDEGGATKIVSINGVAVPVAPEPTPAAKTAKTEEKAAAAVPAAKVPDEAATPITGTPVMGAPIVEENKGTPEPTPEEKPTPEEIAAQKAIDAARAALAAHKARKEEKAKEAEAAAKRAAMERYNQLNADREGNRDAVSGARAAQANAVRRAEAEYSHLLEGVNADPAKYDKRVNDTRLRFQGDVDRAEQIQQSNLRQMDEQQAIIDR